MDRPDAPTRGIFVVSKHNEQSTGLSGYWLVLARAACVAAFGLCLLIFFADLPGYFAQLHLVCSGSACSLWQLTPGEVLMLQHVGLNVQSYATLSVVLSIISVLVWFTMGTIIVWRKSNDWMALLVAILMFDFAVAEQIVPDYNRLTSLLVANASPWFGPTMLLSFLAAFLFLLVFLLFPDGHFMPGWTRWFLVVGLALAAGGGILFIFHAPLSQWRYPLIFGASMCTSVPAMFVQIYRYRSVSTPVQRQQTKWVVSGVIVGVLVVSGIYLPPLLFSPLYSSGLYFLLARPVAIILLLFAPLCFGIAILRHRLWDIDVLINRTLVYGTLTALLALLYFGLVISLESLMRLFTGQVSQSPVIIVASTLAIVTLFNPLRRRLQSFIDRSFYRSKYDATMTLAAFSATLRHEVELDDLSSQLVAAVRETMQPTHVSLWLRPPEHDEHKDSTNYHVPGRSQTDKPGR